MRSGEMRLTFCDDFSFGEWTRSGCLTVVPDIPSKTAKQTVLVNCTCNQLATFAVLVDAIDGEVNHLEFRNFS